MPRLRMRLIRFGDRDGLGTSEATRTRGGLPSVAAGARTDTTWQSREIVGFRNWVLGDQEGIGQVRYCLMAWCLAGDADSAWSRCCEQLGAVFVEATSRIHARRV